MLTMAGLVYGNACVAGRVDVNQISFGQGHVTGQAKDFAVGCKDVDGSLRVHFECTFNHSDFINVQSVVAL